MCGDCFIGGSFSLCLLVHDTSRLNPSLRGDFNNLQHKAATSAIMKVVRSLCGTRALHRGPCSQHGEHPSALQCLAGGKRIPRRIKENSGIKW